MFCEEPVKPDYTCMYGQHSHTHTHKHQCAGAHVAPGLPNLNFSVALLVVYSFIFKDFIYSFIRIHREEREREAEKQAEKQAPCREPDVGLDPGSPGSHPRLKVALNRWVTRAALLA